MYYYDTFVHEKPCRDSISTWALLINEIMNGNEIRCYQDFCLNKTTFVAFFRILVDEYGSVPTQEMSEYEEVGMHLMTVAYECGDC